MRQRVKRRDSSLICVSQETHRVQLALALSPPADYRQINSRPAVRVAVAAGLKLRHQFWFTSHKLRQTGHFEFAIITRTAVDTKFHFKYRTRQSVTKFWHRRGYFIIRYGVRWVKKEEKKKKKKNDGIVRRIIVSFFRTWVFVFCFLFFNNNERRYCVRE